MIVVIATAIFWGMFAYSITVLGIVTGLAIKVALLFRDRGVLRRELDGAERRAKDSFDAAKKATAMTARYKREIKVMSDELERCDDELDPDGVADRLKRLLSGEVSEDDREDGDDRKAVLAPAEAEGDSG